jgi:glycosyltransferase involved in cell wall biosynthesis
MHIRHLVCTGAFAGVEHHVLYVATELARRGHRVDVLGGDSAAMGRRLDAAGVTHVSGGTFRALLKANSERPRPDLVHAHMTAADTVAVITRPLVRRPIVSTLHFAAPRGHSTLTRLAYRGLRPFLTAEIAISATAAAAALGHPKVILNGVPAPVAGEPLPAAEREPVVLLVQRLEPEKHTRLGIEAFARSGLASEGWELHVLGDGVERLMLEALVSELGIAGSVRFLGHVADAGPNLARASLLLATRPDEPFGLSVVEAMAAGLPVVAAGGGGHRETVGPATPGTLFPAGDVDTAAALLARLAHDPAERDRCADALRTRYLAELTIERHVERLEALYRRILSAR